MHPDGLGIYVHVPFCARRCGYCAFVTYAPAAATSSSEHRRWADAAVAEIGIADREISALHRARNATLPAITSVYFGGGTPTAVSTELLAEVLTEVRRRFEVSDDVEVSIEANPDGLSAGQTDELAALGVDRISFGMQSAVPRVLELLDRTHRSDSVPRAVEVARRSGIDSISLDLIHGTPGETAADWDETLEVALGLAPDHLSAYALSIEPGTRLAARVRDRTLPEPSPDEAADRYEALDAAAATAGLRWYELSNWARTPDDRCLHNLGYWQDHDWWGIGPGAHSHLGDRRWWNHPSLEQWSQLALEGALPTAGQEQTSSTQRRTEQIMLGIRLAEGIPSRWAAPGSLDGLIDDGLVSLTGDHVVLTLRGRLLADLVIRRLRWG